MRAKGNFSLIRRMPSSAGPSFTGPARPVPKIASITTVTSLASFPNFRTTGQPQASSMRRFAAASPLRSPGSNSSRTVRLPQSFRVKSCRATTNPSPPLLPFPHTTKTCWSSRSSKVSRRKSMTRLPAFSIKMRPGIPRSIVRRSTSRISAAVRIFMPVGLRGRAKESCRRAVREFRSSSGPHRERSG